MPTYQVRTMPWCLGLYNDDDEARPAGDVVATHANYAEAVDACDALNAKVWAYRYYNPFYYGGRALFFQTTFPPGPFRDYLQDRGLDVPKSRSEVTHAGWVRWYDMQRAKFTDAHRAALREAMNLVRFAEVVEVPDGAAKVYVVQELNWWDYEGLGFLVANPEGGNPVAAYAERPKAAARCAELNAARRAMPAYRGSTDFCVDSRRGVGGPDYAPIGETVFYEVVEIDGVGLRSRLSPSVAVVHRQAIHINGEVVGRNTDCDGELSDLASVVPVRAFADRAAADAYATDLMRVARRALHPISVYQKLPRSTRVRALKIKFRVQPLHKWGSTEWEEWYSAEAPHLSDEERVKVWSLFDDLPLYGVTDVPWGE